MKKISLVLFMTKGGSLSKWMDMGNLERELDVYKELFKKGVETSIISFDEKDNKLKKIVYPLKICPISSNTKDEFLFETVASKYKNILQKADLYKTNQVKGAELAIQLGNEFKKPVIVRSGYLPSRHPKPGDEKTISRIEEGVFKGASVCFVSSRKDKLYLKRKYKISSDKIEVVPNYVNTKFFYPKSISKKYDVVYIGRGSKEKNLLLL